MVYAVVSKPLCCTLIFTKAYASPANDVQVGAHCVTELATAVATAAAAVVGVHQQTVCMVQKAIA
jgi:hypothetical protein